MGIELLLDMAVSSDPDRVLLGTRAEGLTAAEIDRLTAAGATHLLERGARQVAFVGVNGPAFPLTVLAAGRAGIPVTPLNYRLTADALREQIARLDEPLVICDDAYRDQVGHASATMPRDAWLEVLDTTARGDLPFVDDDHTAVTLFTSGTTSTPKSVLLRHRHLTSYVFQTVELGSAGADDAALVSVPPYHVAGVGTVLTNLYAGRRVVHLADFSPERWLETVRSEGITGVMLVPTMLTRIVEHLGGRTAHAPTLRSIAYGGARISPAVLERALEAFPTVDFTNAYGLTETSSTIAVLTPEDHRAAAASDDPAVRRRLASAGTFVPGIEAQVRDADGQPVGPGVQGELWVRGPQVSGEYEGLGSVLDEGGWFPTKDVVHLDDAGYLFVHGRNDDTIIRGGENIAPAEIEDVLAEHPAVADVAVLGTADEEWGQRITAVVVLRGPGATPDELREFVRARLRSSRTPDDVVIRDELPYTPTGKLLRRELAAELS